MKKVIGFVAMVLAIAACNTMEIDNQQNKEEANANKKGITITATLAPKSAETKAIAEDGNTIKQTWVVDETLAVLYQVGSTNMKAEATIKKVEEGKATIEFTVDGGTVDGTACTLVYPASAAKDDNTGVKDAATLLGTQDGTLNANLDVRVGEGTILVSKPSLNVSTQPAPQFAIFKFSPTNFDGTVTGLAVSPLTITIGTQDYVVTPASAASVLYAALPEISANQVVSFSATGSDGTPYSCSTTIKSGGVEAGKYYQAPVKFYVNLDALTGDYTAKDGDGLKGTTTTHAVSIAAGATVTLAGVTIDHSGTTTSRELPGIRCLGDATIVLADGSENTVKGGNYTRGTGGEDISNAAILIQNTYNLTVKGETTGSGTLLATGGNYCPAIGGVTHTGTGTVSNGGNITIVGGVITANGGDDAAATGKEYGAPGIGTGPKGSIGAISIEGGTVTATGGTNAAGIGSAYRATCGNISISGGTVTATAGTNAAGIGCGIGSRSNTSECGTIEITNGVTDVTATKGATGAQSIGTGATYSSCGTITITADASKVHQN